MKMRKHEHEYVKPRSQSNIEICAGCSRFRFTNDAPAIVSKPQTYRVDSKRPGHNWRMDDGSMPDDARWMTFDAAELKRQQLEKQYPTMAFKIVAEEAR